MDSRHFDALTRRLGVAGSRRQALVAFIAGTLAHVLLKLASRGGRGRVQGLQREMQVQWLLLRERRSAMQKAGQERQGPLPLQDWVEAVRWSRQWLPERPD
jgi:hypothetical protein